MEISGFMLRVLLLTIAVMASSTGQAREGFGGYHALVIGNNDYEHLTPLETAVNDATAVARILRVKYDFDVTLLLNATRDQILSAVNVLRATLAVQDRLLIYYAGHGVLDRITDTGYWLPVDAKPEDDTRWIANESLTRHFRAMSARHVLVVADSCYSGSLVRGDQSAPRVNVERSKWLERISRSRARLALVSGALEPVLDGGGGDHSVFAKAFLGTLQDNDEVITGQDLARKVAQEVVLAADQTPQYSNIRKAGHEGGDFIFVPKGSTVIIVTPPEPQERTALDPVALDLEFWRSIKGSKSIANYEAYLERFPDGTFVELAKNQVASLQKNGGIEDGKLETEARDRQLDAEAFVRSDEKRFVDLLARYDYRNGIFEVGVNDDATVVSIEKLEVVRESDDHATIRVLVYLYAPSLNSSRWATLHLQRRSNTKFEIVGHE